MKTPKQRRRIFQPGDVASIELLSLALTSAYSGNYLAARTKMSPSMVYYRLHAAGVKLRDIRNGHYPLSIEIERRVKTYVTNHVYSNILPRFAP